MNNEFLFSIVDFLRFPPAMDAAESPMRRKEQPIGSWSHRAWARHIGVLDRAGLSLPLYARLLESGEHTRLPAETLAAFENRKRDNSVRMLGMLQTFGQAISALQQSGVPHVCVKGFSLFPDFHEDPWQRHQTDFDLLVPPADALRAQTTLEGLGYKLTKVAGDGERRLRIPATEYFDRNTYLYRPQKSAAIELHPHFWESGAEELPLRCPEDAFEQAEMRTLGSVSFLALSRPHAFLYQTLHIFRHFLGSWARLLWLYEIAAYLHRFQDDDALWQQVQALASSDARMSEAVALVLLAAQDLFACPIPQALKAVHALPANSPVRLWINHYARRWLLADMPGNKLNLLLQRHFFSDGPTWRRYLANRLVPLGKHPSLSEGIDRSIAKSFAFRAANLRYQSSRYWHHLHTGVGYATASIVWKMYLHRSQTSYPQVKCFDN
jgi:hypothetical protein